MLDFKRLSILLLLAFACWCCEVPASNAAVTQFVVPKNKPANMSSVYDAGQSAVLGMDGNANDTYIARLQCVHASDSDLVLPWWMGDLLESYAVLGARVWNRRDSNLFYYRLTQVGVALSSNPSAWANFNKDLFQLCDYYTGVPKFEDNPINFTCPGPVAGRYLVLYKNASLVGGSSDKPFHFCEIDILAVTKQLPLYYKIVQPSFSSTSASLLLNVTARPELQCIVQCPTMSTCLYILLAPGPSNPGCWLFSSFFIPDSFSAVYSAGGAKFLAVYG